MLIFMCIIVLNSAKGSFPFWFTTHFPKCERNIVTSWRQAALTSAGVWPLTTGSHLVKKLRHAALWVNQKQKRPFLIVSMRKI